jgi:hypothetical protein
MERNQLQAYAISRCPGTIRQSVAGYFRSSRRDIYNVRITLAPVFPGEQVGLEKGEEHLDLARRTARIIRLEGGNDLVSQFLIRARLGMLDLKWFKS